MTDQHPGVIDYLALGHQLHEQWLASPHGSDPLPLVPSSLREMHRLAWRAVEAEANYFEAARAVGVSKEVARRVLDRELDRWRQAGGPLDDAFARARDSIFSRST